jgi:hypothetical protein
MSEQPQASANSASGERPCPECGEMVRPGLVRCWNCGAFMQRSLEQKYLELQAAPKKIFFSPLPADADIHAVSADLADDDDEDDDFVLAPQGFVPHGHAGAAPAQKAEGKADGSAGADSKSWSGPTAESPAARSPGAPPEPSVSHSVATGGDALLDIAMREVAEEGRKRKKSRRATGGARTANGFIIFCPYGCKIEVKDQHRGMTGKCPKCRAPFLVPIDPPNYSSVKEKSAEAGAAAALVPGGFTLWLTDLHVHTVNPVKLKLKADSLVKEFVEKDFGFSPERLLVAAPGKKAGGGLFGGGDKKKPDPREVMLAHLRENKPIEELPVAEKHVFTPDQVRHMRIVQPASSRMDSMFHGILVFGAHHIAVQLPVAEGDPQFVSFGLMRFREFAKALATNYGIERFGADLGIPLQDEYTNYKCHYTDTPIKALKNDEWYKADPASKAVLAGWKCAGCGLVVSEDARKKEKLGGANGKAIAKSICPKCKKKFGEQPLYTLPDAASAPSMSAETPPPVPTPAAAPASAPAATP